MTVDEYRDLKSKVIDAGHIDEIKWAMEVSFPSNAYIIARETIWVICNSGMKYKIAQKIFSKVINALIDGQPAEMVFKNKNKVRAIQAAWDDQKERYLHFSEIGDTDEDLKYLQSLDGIGPITKYHLARNLGIDVSKPDRHLERIAKAGGFDDSHEMCKKIAEETGDRIGVVDVVIWRAAISGMV